MKHKNKQSKIGVLIDRLNVGGVEKIAIEEVKALRAMGQDAVLVVLRRKAVVPNAFPDLLKGVPIVYLDDRLPRLLRFSLPFPVFNFFSTFHITYPFLLPFVVKKSEYDYFIVHGTYTCFSAISLKKIRKIPFSAFIWDPVSYILERVYSKNFLSPVMWVLKKIAYVLDSFVIRNMDKVLVGGDAHNEFIRQIDPKKKIATVYPSVHPLKKLLKKKDYVLIVTAWKRGKHPEYLLDIVKEVPGIRIKMVGKWVDPEYRKEFTQLLKENKLTKRIEIIGEVSEDELTKYYAEAQILLQTNDDRGFGMPAMEAAGRGTTFIIPRGQGVCSLFADGEDGYYTKEKDTKTICSHLNRLNKDKNLSRSLGINAWKKVKNNYSWEQHGRGLLQVINEHS